MDEARHPLTLIVTGLYGKPVLNQNGAPLRLILPWKYGFKGGKSIVKIRFTEDQPATTWNIAAPGEYGFYANVNPEVDHVAAAAGVLHYFQLVKKDVTYPLTYGVVLLMLLLSRLWWAAD